MRMRIGVQWTMLAATVAGCAGCAGQPAKPAASQPAGAVAKIRPQRHPPVTYLAEGQSVSGTTVQRPSCTDGCPLNELGTVVLYDMSWSAWTSAGATGSGTETIQECATVCSGLPQYRAAVRITLSDPVHDCRTGQAFWTRAEFRFPEGLGGAPAPPDPWDFTALAASARATCGQ